MPHLVDQFRAKVTDAGRVVIPANVRDALMTGAWAVPGWSLTK